MRAHYIPAQRQEFIYGLLSERGVVTVAELKPMLGVAEITIRRDLDILERKGVLEPLAPGIDLVLVGGLHRPQSNSLVGRFATSAPAQVYGSKAIIGVDGITFKYGLTTPARQEAEVAAFMIERTRGQVIVVADRTKIGVVSNFVTARIEALDILVTDSEFEEECRAELEGAGMRIVIAGRPAR